jgi:hypothetical protein
VIEEEIGCVGQIADHPKPPRTLKVDRNRCIEELSVHWPFCSCRWWRHVQPLRRIFFSGIFFIGTGPSIASFRNRAARKRSVLASRTCASALVMACAALVVASPLSPTPIISAGTGLVRSGASFVSPDEKKAGRTRPSPQRLNGQCQ